MEREREKERGAVVGVYVGGRGSKNGLIFADRRL
jgi:hypothetical protein